MPYIGLAQKFDPLKTAVDYGTTTDVDVHAWVRLTNFNREPYANFWRDHPEYHARMLKTQRDPTTGQQTVIKPYQLDRYPRVLSFAYPEVRSFYVSFFQQIASTGTSGIMIDLLRHPPIAGYEPIVTESFREAYGKEMRELDIYHDALIQEHVSGYMKQFLVELRNTIGDDIEVSVRCSGPRKFALRGKEWIAEGLINTIIDGHWYSGYGPRPTIDSTVEAVGAQGRALAVAEVSDVDPKDHWKRREGYLSAEAINALTRHYSGRGVAAFGLYESTVFTWRPDIRRAIRQSGWAFAPDAVGKRQE